MFSKLKRRFDGKGKRLAALTLAASLLCGIAGCSKEQAISPASGNGVVSNSENVSISGFESDTTSILETTGKFDWDKALSEFYIDSIKMEFPFSESSLGENFIFKIDEARYTSDDGNGCLTVVVDYKDYNGLWLFEAQYKGITKETYKPDLVPDKIYSIDRPIVQGIKEGTSMDNVYALWGKPDETEQTVLSSDRTKVIYYGKDDGQRLCLRYNNNSNMVESIEIDFTNTKG